MITELINRRLFMIRTLYIKIAIVVVLVLMYDDLVDFLVHFANIAFDGVEYSIELGVALLFQTNDHDTEIISNNFLVFLAFCGLFMVIRLLPRLLRNLRLRWDRFMLRIVQNWVTLSLLQKIKAVATSTLVFSCFAVWVFI